MKLQTFSSLPAQSLSFPLPYISKEKSRPTNHEEKNSNLTCRKGKSICPNLFNDKRQNNFFKVKSNGLFCTLRGTSTYQKKTTKFPLT